jgi:hypothetical protein
MFRRVRRVSAMLAVGGVWVFGVALGAALVGCGPIVYVSEVSRHASDAVDTARAVQAEKYAPYWWTRATQYLDKAREVAAHADFQGANRFGRLAAEAAEKATEEAQIAARDPSKRPLDLQPDVAPAKDAPAPARAPAKDPTPAKDAPAPARAPARDPTPARDAPAPARAPAKDPTPPRDAPAPRASPAKVPAPKRTAPAKDAS